MKKPTIWYRQNKDTCPTHGLVMLFSYLTGIKLEENQFLGVNKTILNLLKDGDLGAKATITNLKKRGVQAFIDDINASPLACDITMFKELNYNLDEINHPEYDLTPMGGHRMLILEHDPVEGLIHFANTSGKNKVQKMDFALFYYSLRKYMKMNIENGLTEITPLSQADKRWKNVKIGKSTATIGRYGCLITSICMLMERLRGEPANPADGAYYWKFNAKGELSWTTTSFRDIDYMGKGKFSLENCKSWTTNKKGCAIKVVNKKIPEHFVVCDKVVGDRIQIIDPIDGKFKWLDETDYRAVDLRLFVSE